MTDIERVRARVDLQIRLGRPRGCAHPRTPETLKLVGKSARCILCIRDAQRRYSKKKATARPRVSPVVNGQRRRLRNWLEIGPLEAA